jgi:hypothetical protein
MGGGSAPLASMFTTTNAINTTGASGFIEFYVQTRDLFATNNCGWTMQVSSDNGATWNTRLSEDWNAETVSLSNVVINAAGAVAGSTTVTCTSTAGLTTSRSVLAAPVNVTIGITSWQFHRDLHEHHGPRRRHVHHRHGHPEQHARRPHHGEHVLHPRHRHDGHFGERHRDQCCRQRRCELLRWQRDREQHHERHDLRAEHRRLCEHERRPHRHRFRHDGEPRLPALPL